MEKSLPTSEVGLEDLRRRWRYATSVDFITYFTNSDGVMSIAAPAVLAKRNEITGAANTTTH